MIVATYDKNGFHYDFEKAGIWYIGIVTDSNGNSKHFEALPKLRTNKAGYITGEYITVKGKRIDIYDIKRKQSEA